MVARKKARRRAASRRYDVSAAARFWTQRVRTASPLAAVLTYDAHPLLNSTYDKWERRLLVDSLPSSAGPLKALDLGCGIGRISVLLAKKGAEVIAQDVSPEMLKRCAARARSAGVVSRITTILGSAHHLPNLRRKQDVVTCFGLLEHLPDRYRRACLRQAFSLLKKRGKLLAVVNNSRNPLLRPRYKAKQSVAAGYYVSLVGLDWLRTFCNRHGMSLTVRGCNPAYAVLHYVLMADRKHPLVSDEEGRHLCKLAWRIDLEGSIPEPARSQLASHFFVEIQHLPTSVRNS